MFDSQFPSLLEVVDDAAFPEADLALRFGRHIDADEATMYEFLREAQPHLERFYQRYGYELVHAQAGFFFLLPQAEKLGRRHLGLAEMLVGQVLALTYLDPSTVDTGGAITRSQVIEMLSHIVGENRLMAALHPRKRRADERVAQEAVRREVDRALRALAALGFCDLVDDENVAIRASVLRFVEPVQGIGDPREALQTLMAGGQAVQEGVAMSDEDEEALDASAEND